MPNSSAEMIREIAKSYGIAFENTSVECLLFIYALVFKEAEQILEKPVDTISKKSIKRIMDAFNEIHMKLGHLKGESNLKGKRYGDVEVILPLLGKILGHLIEVFKIYNRIKPDPRHSPEKVLLPDGIISHCSEKLLACRIKVIDINNQIGWWCKEEKAKDCVSLRSASPSTPISIVKEKKERKRKLA